MRIWVDADACPGAVKEILFRAAMRTRVELTLVANHPMRTPKSSYVRRVQVEPGFDVADKTIAARVAPGDLVITADVPLASIVVDAGATALNPRGQVYTRENVKELLARRNLNDELRSAGAITGGPAALDARDLQAFANALDRHLTQRLQQEQREQ